MVQRPDENASVTVTSASGATMPKVERIDSKSRRFDSEATMLSDKRPCSMSASPLSAACASSVTTSISVGLPVDAEDQVLVGGKLAVEYDRTVSERAFGARFQVRFGDLYVAQPRRQLHVGDELGHRIGGGQPG